MTVALWLEGDSYMQGAYGVVLGDLTATITGLNCVNTAIGGSSMAGIRDRILANPAYASRTLVVWDGSESPGYVDPVSYCDQLQTGLTALGHNRFVIIPPCVGFSSGTTNPLAIRAEMQLRWPSNVLDWRNYIANTAGVVNQDQMANYPADSVHLGITAMLAMATGIRSFLGIVPTTGAVFQRNDFQNNVFQVGAADTTRGGETVLTDRRGAGGYSRKQHDEFLKAKHAAQVRARKLKKAPAEELREAVAIASQAVSLLGDFAPSLVPVTEALMAAATADAAHAMQAAVNAVNAARLLLDRIEEDEDDVMLLLSI